MLGAIIGWEAVVVVIVVVLLFGGSLLPKLARSLRRIPEEFRAGRRDVDPPRDPPGTQP